MPLATKPSAEDLKLARLRAAEWRQFHDRLRSDWGTVAVCRAAAQIDSDAELHNRELTDSTEHDSDHP